ncbi:MAG TPA: hypothetical protein VHU23_12515 [Rhizomicrobium sp.]|jgi:hypothetical protein|nr:hypothetical protein [Rhizomicrobium sp.]
MTSKMLFASVVLLNASAASASEFPVKDAHGAIAIAKIVCSVPHSPSSNWHAHLDVVKRAWIVTTVGATHCNGFCVSVVIPVRGPKAGLCTNGFDDRVWITPKKSN